MPQPLIYIVILNWSRREDTLVCITSVQALVTPNTRILVVDNGSYDNSVAAIRAKFPDVELIEAGRNLGFAGGMNLGICQALTFGADYIFLLNNDTIVDPHMLDQLLAHTAPDVGLLAPAIFYADSPQRIWSVGGGFNSLLLEMTGNHGRNQPLPGCPLERGFLSGCALLVHRGIFERVGLFDERFFMYYEDLDFCLRVRQSGHRLLLVPEARLWHRVSQSSGGAENPYERYYMALSSGLYFRKHMRGWQALIIVPYRLLSALRWTIRLVWHRRWEALAAYWRGLLSGWMGIQAGPA